MEKYGIMPIGSYWLSCDFGGYKGHKGCDFGYKQTIGYKTEVWAWKSGKVVDCNYRADSGNYVVIEHDHSTYRQWTRYLHLDTCKVKIGDVVSQGQVIGIRGNTGKSGGPHLHFQITEEAPLNQAYNRDWCANSGVDVKPLVYKSPSKEYVLDEETMYWLKDMPSDKKDYKTLYESALKDLKAIKKIVDKY